MKELGSGRAYNTHNITSLILTLKYVSDILQTEEAFTVEEYKHTHTRTIPATSASVERANADLKFVKNVYRSKMSEDRLNSLILIYVYKDIKLDYNVIIDMYARRNPRRMLVINRFGDK